MNSVIRHVGAQRAMVGRALVIAAGAAGPININTPPGEHARMSGGDLAAVAASTEVAFEHTVNGATNIYRSRIDGTGLTRLTSGASDFNADWSPDGAKIAFGSFRDGLSDIYVMSADGSNQVRLTVALDAWQPVWSPDGSKIVFLSFDSIASEVDLCVMNADGSHQVRLAQRANEPSWSPDSRHIAFSSWPDGAIHVINADGTGERPLHSGALFGEVLFGTEGSPAWSPDGSKIAFTVGNGYVSVDDDFVDENIFVANVDGSGVTQLAQRGQQPVWSPDGTRLVFLRWADCTEYGCPHSGLMAVNADGSNLTQLTSGQYDEEVSWSHDGSWIAFHEYRCDEIDEETCIENGWTELVRLMRPDGSQFVDLVTAAAAPSWKP
jgi:TolB protein